MSLRFVPPPPTQHQPHNPHHTHPPPPPPKTLHPPTNTSPTSSNSIQHKLLPHTVPRDTRLGTPSYQARKATLLGTLSSKSELSFSNTKCRGNTLNMPPLSAGKDGPTFSSTGNIHYACRILTK